MSRAHLFEITEGWGAELGPFTLTSKGEAFALPTTVDLVIGGTDGAQVDTEGWVRVADAQSGDGKGKVYFTPDPDVLRAANSPYTIRWRVPGAPDQEPVFVPNGDADVFIVFRPFG